MNTYTRYTDIPTGSRRCLRHHPGRPDRRRYHRRSGHRDGRGRDPSQGHRRHLGPAERRNVDVDAGYLHKLRPYLRYDQALAAGWPIATGIIEGACRHIVKDRMDLTGARWGLPGAETILRLRALISNGDFDDYWAFHLHQEHHHSRYRDTLTLAA